jgi:hypothetical protein
MGAKPESLRSFLERYWGAQCQLVGNETLERLLAEADKGNTKVESWAIKKAGGTPMDVEIALSGLAVGIAFLQLLLQVYDELAKRKKPTAAELKAELSKVISTSNSAEQRVLTSDRGEKIIDELTR